MRKTKKRKSTDIIHSAAVLWLLISAAGCRGQVPEHALPVLRVDCGELTDAGVHATRALMPDEDGIWNINFFIYDGYALPEVHEYITFDQARNGVVEIPLETVTGRNCSVFVFANAGFRMPDYEMEDLMNLRYHLAYPDDYSKGIPASGMISDAPLDREGIITIKLRRLMAKLSLRVDRSALDSDVDFNVCSVKVGNCAKSASAFRQSAAGSPDDCFATGFTLDGTQAQPLNVSNKSGMSSEAVLYMLENMPDMEGKGETDLASYIEIGIDYASDEYYTEGGKPLIYRFLIQSHGEVGVERNVHYRVTVKPECSGLLCEDSWRVDKSGLCEFSGDPYMKIIPSGTTVDGKFYKFYYEMGRSESRHFDLSYYPPDMKVKLRESFVTAELEEGRARWTMDDDGKGFTVETLGRQCATMMDIIPGAPLTDDDQETVVIYVD